MKLRSRKLKKVNNVKLKFKVWDQYGKPVDKIKGSPVDINARIRKVFKKYS